MSRISSIFMIIARQRREQQKHQQCEKEKNPSKIIIHSNCNGEQYENEVLTIHQQLFEYWVYPFGIFILVCMVLVIKFIYK